MILIDSKINKVTFSDTPLRIGFTVVMYWPLASLDNFHLEEIEENRSISFCRQLETNGK